MGLFSIVPYIHALASDFAMMYNVAYFDTGLDLAALNRLITKVGLREGLLQDQPPLPPLQRSDHSRNLSSKPL